MDNRVELWRIGAVEDAPPVDAMGKTHVQVGLRQWRDNCLEHGTRVVLGLEQAGDVDAENEA